MDKEELINGYFEGSLNQSQLKEVALLRSTDAEFAAELEFQKELQTALKKEERRELKARFNKLSKNETEATTKVFSIRPWLAAASIALLIGLGSWFLFFNVPNLNTAELYAANFVPYDNVIQPIERGNQLENLKTKAFEAYENGSYKEALDLFKELHTKQNDSYIDFYSAMILMQLDQQEEAIPLLKKYLQKEGELKDRALWYLALAHLKLNDIDHCKEQLHLLIENNGYKLEAAKDLLKALD